MHEVLRVTHEVFRDVARRGCSVQFRRDEGRRDRGTGERGGCMQPTRHAEHVTNRSRTALRELRDDRVADGGVVRLQVRTDQRRALDRKSVV